MEVACDNQTRQRRTQVDSQQKKLAVCNRYCQPGPRKSGRLSEGRRCSDCHIACDFGVLSLGSRSLIREIVKRLYFKILESILLTALKAPVPQRRASYLT